ncbi:PAS domain-containing protein [Occallatibacter riparius]|uniref:histidine kinase n=1 Tax=Occallatibacter riparius TaxID=1002689 RepID=A0A9J7BYF3_9BACT|nr:PAS domain-containing protein [Occallatibacter riparius]UWZ86453.1 PAS domain-containing protein [Occallatibacter riparius]
MAAGRTTCAVLAILFFGLPLLSVAPMTGAQAKGVRTRNVLVLSSGRGRKSLNQMESSLRSRVPFPVDFSIIDLANPHFDEDSFRANLAKALHSAYGEKPDLVIACMDQALRFATQYHDTIFAGLPIVFMSVPSMTADQEKSPDVTGVAVVPSTHETIDLALRLHPDTTTLAVISGKSVTGDSFLAAVHSELLRHSSRVKEIDIVGPPSGQMLEKVAALPPRTVVLFQLSPEDSEQPAVTAFDVLTEASQRLPTYSLEPSLVLDHGGIGGATTDATQDAVMAGEIGARVLSGEAPARIPVVYLSKFQFRMDWRQLQRWHIPESALPPGSIVLYRQPTLWQQYKGYVIAGISLILLEAGLIVALLWNRARRRRSEKELVLLYDRLRLAVEAASSVSWDADYKHGKNRWHGDLQTMFGIPDSQHDVNFGDFLKLVHPDDRERVADTLAKSRESRKPYVADFRVIRTDGTLRWVTARGKFYHAPNGEPERMLGIATDTTARKLAEEALRRLSGQLINAQEEERRRIAREIHDDFQQRLAVLAIELESLSQDIGEKDAIALAQLRDLARQVNALGTDLHSLSHRLHSSTLDSMGLVPALRGLCAEFRKHHDLDVSLVAENVPRKIPNEAALCLFRIAQEGLQNARKHSSARSAELRVQGLEGKLHLSISDGGVGFNLEEAVREGGIGIRSMEERARLVNGRLEVRSKPGSGTTIEVWVPVPVSEESFLEV